MTLRVLCRLCGLPGATACVCVYCHANVQHPLLARVHMCCRWLPSVRARVRVGVGVGGAWVWCTRGMCGRYQRDILSAGCATRHCTLHHNHGHGHTGPPPPCCCCCCTAVPTLSYVDNKFAPPPAAHGRPRGGPLPPSRVHVHDGDGNGAHGAGAYGMDDGGGGAGGAGAGGGGGMADGYGGMGGEEGAEGQEGGSKGAFRVGVGVWSSACPQHRPQHRRQHRPRHATHDATRCLV